VNVKGFFVTALGQALELHVATPDDVLRHVTADVLSTHLPRPLWARLLTACLGAARVDAQLVVETIGVPNLCEHIPAPIIWACIAEIGARAIGREGIVTMPVAPQSSAPTLSATPRPLSQMPSARTPLTMSPPPAERPTPPPAPAPTAVGPTIPAPGRELADVVAALESEDKPSTPSRSRTPTGQRFRQSNTGIGRLAATSSRRPQAAAAPPEPPSPSRLERRSAEGPDSLASAPARPNFRGNTEADAYDVVTEVGKDDWKNALAVEDEQLVDWSATDDNTVTHDNTDGYGRKR
jgi:hypothetical protein